MVFTVNGLEVLIDDEDAHLITGIYMRLDERGYVFTILKTTGVRKLLHRIIKNAPLGYVVHHKNGNKLDNRKANLCLMSHRKHAQLHRGKAVNDFRQWCKDNKVNSEMANAGPLYYRSTGRTAF